MHACMRCCRIKGLHVCMSACLHVGLVDHGETESEEKNIFVLYVVQWFVCLPAALQRVPGWPAGTSGQSDDGYVRPI
jgi:hypothetical protein